MDFQEYNTDRCTYIQEHVTPFPYLLFFPKFNNNKTTNIYKSKLNYKQEFQVDEILMKSSYYITHKLGAEIMEMDKFLFRNNRKHSKHQNLNPHLTLSQIYGHRSIFINISIYPTIYLFFTK